MSRRGELSFWVWGVFLTAAAFSAGATVLLRSTYQPLWSMRAEADRAQADLVAMRSFLQQQSERGARARKLDLARLESLVPVGMPEVIPLREQLWQLAAEQHGIYVDYLEVESEPLQLDVGEDVAPSASVVPLPGERELLPEELAQLSGTPVLPSPSEERFDFGVLPVEVHGSAEQSEFCALLLDLAEQLPSLQLRTLELVPVDDLDDEESAHHSLRFSAYFEFVFEFQPEDPR